MATKVRYNHPSSANTFAKQTSDVTDDGRNRDKLDINLLKISYDERLNTYKNRWRSLILQPEALAHAGFYYTGYSDIVCCPYCNVEVGKWVPGDDPLTDHIKWSPACKFLEEMHLYTDGTPQQPPTTSSAPSLPGSGQDTCGKYGIVQSSTSIPENSSVVAGSATLANHVGIQQVQLPSYKHYALIEKRLETFQDWPVSIAQKPKELAEAGFFYTGKSDQTVCYHCGGGLKDWECNDQPWQQHAKWFPQCPYVTLQKGTQYVSEQQAQKKPDATAEEETAVAVAELETAKVEAAAGKVENIDKEHPLDSTPNNVLCKICYSKEVGVVFLPCGHMVACVDCAPALPTCAVCRKKVDAYVRAFLS